MFGFKNFKKSSVYITPNLPVIQTKRYKVKIQTILAALILYSFFIVVLVITILALTPAKEAIFILENEKLKEQSIQIKQLQEKVIYFSKELELLASKNRKLKYAMILAGTDSLDSTSAVYDSLRYEPNKNLPYGGSVLHSFRKLLLKLFQKDNVHETKIYFIKPLSGFISRDFEPDKGHLGIDFSVKTGTPVSASAGGLVIFSGFTIDFGNTLIIKHSNDYITKYYHCSSLLKREREFIEQGEIIALSGNTGLKTTGPHLHFELWYNGKPIDPEQVLINLFKDLWALILTYWFNFVL